METHDAIIEDVIDVLTKDEEDPRGETDVQRISPVQFLRDRELGIRGTGERIVRQKIDIDIDAESVYDWPYHVRRKVYGRMLDKCVKEQDESKLAAYLPYHKRDDYYHWSTKIIHEIEYNSALYITIYTCIGKCIELLVVDNLYHRDYSRFDIASRTMLENIYDDDKKDLDAWQHNYEDAPFFYRHNLMQMHYYVLNSERSCLSCGQVTCKCSVEECDVI